VLEPLATIVTDISFDHMEILGATLRRIAIEKAGIIKTGIPHITGLLPREAAAVMRDTCRHRHAPYRPLNKTSFSLVPGKLQLEFRSPELRFKRLSPSLVGLHQLRNAALVLHTVGLLRKQGLPLSQKAIRTGIESAEWSGRFQILKRPRQPIVILDVGHNAGGVRAFVESFKIKFPGRRAAIIAGFVKKKQHEEMLAALAEVASSIDVVRLATRRSGDTRAMRRFISQLGVPSHRYGRLDLAYKRLVQSLDPDDIIVVCGSHYLVGEFLSRYGR